MKCSEKRSKLKMLNIAHSLARPNDTSSFPSVNTEDESFLADHHGRLSLNAADSVSALAV